MWSVLGNTLLLAATVAGLALPVGTLLGWLGVALTGSDTASNVLFGSLQKITAEQTEREDLESMIINKRKATPKGSSPNIESKH